MSIEDVVQDTFIRAMSAWSTYDEERSQIQTWLFRIAKNTMIDFICRISKVRNVYIDNKPKM